jgi:hypothetical protein
MRIAYTSGVGASSNRLYFRSYSAFRAATSSGVS